MPAFIGDIGMYGKKYPIILIVISSLILSLSITSCNQNRNNEHEMAPAVPFMFHVFDPGHGEILGDDFAKELKDELNENMVWTAPPYFWADIEPSDDQVNWDELDGFMTQSHVFQKPRASQVEIAKLEPQTFIGPVALIIHLEGHGLAWI